MQTTHTSKPTQQSEDELSRSLILLLAVGAGLGVASLYYSQPMLSLLGPAMHTSDRLIGFVPTLTQLGYALGILLLSPLGDRFNRRFTILIKTVALAASLALCAAASNLIGMLVASILIGLSATLAQDIVPAVATLAPAERRGKTIGTVMTGLLLGILLSRVASGIVADRNGWRTVYLAASVAVLAVAAAIWKHLPHFHPDTQVSYMELLGSMKGLWKSHADLRRAAIAQGILSIGFSAFWSSLAIMLHNSFHLGSSVAGAFGLAGAAGSLAAPLAGRLSDRRGPELVTKLGCALATLSFALMGLAFLLTPQQQLVLLVLSAIGFDFGVQATLVSHQTIVYGLDSAARSRLNALLFTCMFLGMAVGSTLGSFFLTHWGWSGVTVLSTASSFAALLIRSVKSNSKRAKVKPMLRGLKLEKLSQE